MMSRVVRNNTLYVKSKIDYKSIFIFVCKI